MKINNSNDNNILLGNLPNSTDFSIANTPEFFSILSSNLYSNPVLAVIRETLTNAYDAHLQNNITEPVKVTVETLKGNAVKSTYKLTVRDYGTGIDPEEIHDIYCTYGNSNKRDTDLTGGFGLGCKSPFAVAESFLVTSFFSGSKNVYLMSKKEGVPTYTLLSSEPTTEHGLEVEIVFNEQNLNKNIIDRIKAFAYFCDININLNGEDLLRLNIKEPGVYIVRYEYYPKTLPSYTSIITNNDFKDSILIRYGNNLYAHKITGKCNAYDKLQAGINSLFYRIRNSNKQNNDVYSFKVLIVAEPNSLDVTPSRESLNYTYRTINTIEYYWFNKIDEYISNTIKNTDSILDKYFNNNLFNILKSNYLDNITNNYYITLEQLAPYCLLDRGSITGSMQGLSGYITNKLPKYPNQIQELINAYYEAKKKSPWSRNIIYHMCKSLGFYRPNDDSQDYLGLYTRIYDYFFRDIKEISKASISLYSSETACDIKILLKEPENLDNAKAYSILTDIFVFLATSNVPIESLSLVPVIILPRMSKELVQEYIEDKCKGNYYLAIIINCSNSNKAKTIEKNLTDNNYSVINLVENNQESLRPIDLLRNQLKESVEEFKKKGIQLLPITGSMEDIYYRVYWNTWWGSKLGPSLNQVLNTGIDGITTISISKTYMENVVLKGYHLYKCNSREYKEFMKIVPEDFNTLCIKHINKYLREHPDTANLVKMMFAWKTWSNRYTYSENASRKAITNIMWCLLQTPYKKKYFFDIDLTEADYTILGLCGCIAINDEYEFYKKIFSKIPWSKCKKARKFYRGIFTKIHPDNMLSEYLDKINRNVKEILTYTDENKNDLNIKICFSILDILFGDIYGTHQNQSNDNA